MTGAIIGVFCAIVLFAVIGLLVAKKRRSQRARANEVNLVPFKRVSVLFKKYVKVKAY